MRIPGVQRPPVAVALLLVALAPAAGGWAQHVEACDAVKAPWLVAPSPWVRPGPGPLPALPAPELVKAHVGAATLEDSIDQCVTQSMDAAGTPGASVAVALEGSLIYQAGYGVKHRQSGGEVDAQTMFRIGSVTKQLTAAAVLQQVESGTAFLDDPVTRYIPELELASPGAADRITVRHLLTHTSGYPDLEFDVDGPHHNGALAEWAASQQDVVLHAPPGVFWNYSNPNFNLAGLVVERASGEPFRGYLTRHIFGPAGMERTTFDPDEVVADGNYSYGHLTFPGGTEMIYAPDDYDNAAYAPAGYAFSTAGDLVRWALTLLDGGGPVLGRESARMLQAPLVDLEQVPGYGYGFGVMVEPFAGLTLRQHGGNIWGWGAYLIWEPEHDFAVAVLANTVQSLAAAAYCITDLLVGQEPVELPPDSTDPSTWGRFAGTWDFTTWMNYPIVGEVVVDDEETLRLFLWDPRSIWNEWYELHHVGYEIFLADFDGDGTPETDFTFINRGDPERVGWLRNRILVGSKRVAPRQGGLPVVP